MATEVSALSLYCAMGIWDLGQQRVFARDYETALALYAAAENSPLNVAPFPWGQLNALIYLGRIDDAVQTFRQRLTMLPGIEVNDVRLIQIRHNFLSGIKHDIFQTGAGNIALNHLRDCCLGKNNYMATIISPEGIWRVTDNQIVRLQDGDGW